MTLGADSSFNPQPAAQAHRRPADFFKRCPAAFFGNKAKRNVASVDVTSAAPCPLLFEARLTSATGRCTSYV